MPAILILVYPHREEHHIYAYGDNCRSLSTSFCAPLQLVPVKHGMLCAKGQNLREGVQGREGEEEERDGGKISKVMGRQRGGSPRATRSYRGSHAGGC